MVYINALIKINLNFNKAFQPVAEIRYIPFKVHWSYGVLFCHSRAQELFILLDVRSIDYEYCGNGMENG